MPQYDKLVRDKIPEICEKDGFRAETRIIEDPEELRAYLYAKLDEEVAELKADPSLGEHADVREVLDAIAQLDGHHLEAVDYTKRLKVYHKGAFVGRIVLISTEPIAPTE